MRSDKDIIEKIIQTFTVTPTPNNFNPKLIINFNQGIPFQWVSTLLELILEEKTIIIRRASFYDSNIKNYVVTDGGKALTHFAQFIIKHFKIMDGELDGWNFRFDRPYYHVVTLSYSKNKKNDTKTN